jgi:hypothetical protein
MSKKVSLVKTGISEKDANARTVSFNALAIAGDEQTETTFVLDAGDARQLGRELTAFADQVLAEIRQQQSDTIRRIEQSRGGDRSA